jgi:hypothetical protein
MSVATNNEVNAGIDKPISPRLGGQQLAGSTRKLSALYQKRFT